MRLYVALCDATLVPVLFEPLERMVLAEHAGDGAFGLRGGVHVSGGSVRKDKKQCWGSPVSNWHCNYFVTNDPSNTSHNPT